MPMAADYDAPRRADADDMADESMNELTAGRGKDAAGAALDVDDGDIVDSYDLPGEFTCSCCFLVYPRSRLAERSDGQQVCTDCVLSRSRIFRQPAVASGMGNGRDEHPQVSSRSRVQGAPAACVLRASFAGISLFCHQAGLYVVRRQRRAGERAC
jgi:hypothetical protein